MSKLKKNAIFFNTNSNTNASTYTNSLAIL